MSKVIRVSEEVYKRLENHVQGFDSPQGVIERLLDYYEGVETNSEGQIQVTKSEERSTMTRGEFVRSHGATCKNWNWSWSFVNDDEKFVIFGAWDNLEDENGQVVLCETWERNVQGRKLPGYSQSINHIDLVENHGYKLKTFKMFGSNGGTENDSTEAAKIESIQLVLFDKTIKRIGDRWYAV